MWVIGLRSGALYSDPLSMQKNVSNGVTFVPEFQDGDAVTLFTAGASVAFRF